LYFEKLYGENKSCPSDRKEIHCEVAVLLPLLVLLFVVGKSSKETFELLPLGMFFKTTTFAVKWRHKIF
jgi:hypothetical protein